MNVDYSQRSDPIPIPHLIAQVEPCKWIKVWHELPKQGQIVPVWDGDYLYYAAFWDKEGKQFWIITDQMGVNLDDIHLRKKQGEQVYPLQWMKINIPTQN